MIKWVFVLAILRLLFNSIFAASPEELCGVAKPMFEELPSDGSPVPRGSWPWLVAILQNENDGLQFRCGGTLISKRIILTTAGCISDVVLFDEKPLMPEEIVLYVGKHDRSSNTEDGSVQYGVQHIIVHPDYSPGTRNVDGDIALLVADREIEYTDFIRPACVWNGDKSIKELVGQEGSLVGWGHNATGQASNVPKRKRGRLVSHKDCLKSDPVFASLMTRRTFCTSSVDGPVPCKYDTGSGFMLQQNGKWTIRGIHTLSVVEDLTGRCHSDMYTLSTDVAKFKGWLTEEIKKYPSLS